jgi:transcription-repair coupling factor (superfamily II helicase)
MADFYRQRCNVLVCSTIVENGIDVSTANTIIIQRADKFGLSQLHQLRGRVGRSHHRAFAYLIVPDKRSMTTDAIKRLEALASLEELGAGFTLATHDLEIRGAGELLGEGQSGQISEVGFTLYTEMLERAVSAIKAGKLPDLDAPLIRPAEIDLHLPALIPEDFLPDVHARLTLYKRVSACHDDSELDDLMGEMIDRFGLLPPQTQNLFAIAKLKLLATRLGIRKLDLGPLGGRILFNPKPSVDPLKIIQLIQRDAKNVALDGPDKLRLKTPLADPAGRMSYATEILRRLS